MSDRAATFIAAWIRDNGLAGGSGRDGASAFAAMLGDAHKLGIGLAEFEEEVGDVPAYLAATMRADEATELRRLGESGATDV